MFGNSLFPSFLLLSLTGTGLAQTALSVSKDATCGENVGFTCTGSQFGDCCSQYGWCGSTDGHCGAGCKSGFGACKGSSGLSSSPPSSSSTVPTPSSIKTSTQGDCGGSGGLTCLGFAGGECCSQYGWCGSTDAYCAAGCQLGYGKCNGASGGTSTIKSSTTASPSSISSKQSSGFTTSTTSTTTSPSSSSTSLNDCLGSKNVPVSWTTSSNFAQLSKPYNLRLPWKPAAIVLPTTVKHVQDAVLCAAKAKVKVQARSGGHSYAAFGLGGRDGSMVVDLQGFQAVTLDSANVASVGGGVRLGNLALALHSKGKRAVSHGTCPGVGIGGHFTHGGYGYSSRAWGLALDSIAALDVVLADGTFVKATAAANPELFYALRGAGESFGVVTTFYLRTKAAPATVVNWSFQLPGMFADPGKTARAFLHIQDFARNASAVDRNLGFGVYMDGETFSIGGTYFGTLARFNSVVKPELLRTLPAPSSQSVQSVDWIKSLTLLSGQSTIQVPTAQGAYDEHDNFFAKSLTVPEVSPLTLAGLTAYFRYMIDSGAGVGQAGGAWFSIVNLYGGPDSQINAVPASSSAYSDRAGLWVLQHYGYTAGGASPFPAAVTSFVEGLSGSLASAMPGVDFGGYSNYVDPSLSADQAHEEYYGFEAYGKLLALKKRLDPDGVFWNPQAIGA